ncbi:MAG TPA: CDP-alcohol phosphatidyltransferase family protein, partial [Desulfurococcales archaeon]|nr:CDP-alcohol phosphatidyltransferase family protein [Desulfurococcales archaeon]
MLTRLRRISRRLVKPVVNILLKLGIRANHLTLLSLTLLPLYVYSLTVKWGIIAIVVLVIIGFLDLVDGELARARGESTPLGSFLDSFTDRVVDVVVIGGLILLG